MAKPRQKTGAEVLEQSEDDSPAAVTAGNLGAMTGQMMSSGRGDWQSAEGLGGTLAAGDVLEDALKQDQVSVKRTDQHAAARVIPSRGGLAKAIGSHQLGPGLPDDPGAELASSDLTGAAGSGDPLGQTLDDDLVSVDTSQGTIHAETPTAGRAPARNTGKT
jgi:hypothetical protein